MGTTIENKEMTMTNGDGSITRFIGRIERTDHGTFDEDGNPKISIKITVPPVNLNAEPGKVQ